MESLISLVSRHNKVFRRDRTAVFFSLLSVLIVIGLYFIFLQKMQIDAIKQVTNASQDSVAMVNEWVVAGMLSMISVTSTLAAFGLSIQDREMKVAADFLTAPISRAKIQLSYVINAFIIGLTFSFIAFIISEIFIVATGGSPLSIEAALKVIGLLILSVLLASSMNMLFVLFTNTLSAFSTLSTIIGTLIGFLAGVYVPIGVLPTFAQNLIMVFPISHASLLLRDAFMANSFNKVFEGVPAEYIEQYKITYGVTYEMNGSVLPTSTSLVVIIGSIIIFTFVSIIIFKKKNK
jgi:multidrug/hemolysin transport system permease protein